MPHDAGPYYTVVFYDCTAEPLPRVGWPSLTGNYSLFSFNTSQTRTVVS